MRFPIVCVCFLRRKPNWHVFLAYSPRKKAETLFERRKIDNKKREVVTSRGAFLCIAPRFISHLSLLKRGTTEMIAMCLWQSRQEAIRDFSP
jgi:hypothetical protein